VLLRPNRGVDQRWHCPAAAADVVQHRLCDFEPNAWALQTGRDRAADVVHIRFEAQTENICSDLSCRSQLVALSFID
jgi:hypothetical protein